MGWVLTITINGELLKFSVNKIRLILIIMFCLRQEIWCVTHVCQFAPTIFVSLIKTFEHTVCCYLRYLSLCECVLHPHLQMLKITRSLLLSLCLFFRLLIKPHAVQVTNIRQHLYLQNIHNVTLPNILRTEIDFRANVARLCK
jgi:hypothetical protein